MYQVVESKPRRRRRDPAIDFCGLKDYELRGAMRRRFEARGCEAVVEELNLPGDVRADLVESGRLIHGYEIKAGLDSLVRLPKQADAYSAVCDRCTIVTVDWHFDEVKKLLPDFWGILVLRSDGFDDVLVEVRKAGANDRQRIDSLLQLLWHQELVAALRGRGLSSEQLKETKARLAALLASVAPANEVRRIVREAITARARRQTIEKQRRADEDFARLVQVSASRASAALIR